MKNAGRAWLIGLISFVLGFQPASAATSLEGGGMWSLDRSDIGTAGLIGIRLQALRPGATGSDVGLSVFANPGGDPAWVGGTFDLGVAHGVPLETRTLFVPSLGFTLLGGVAEGGGAGRIGLVAGAGVVSLPERGVGGRLDSRLRWLFSPSELWLAVTLGLVWPGQQP